VTQNLRADFELVMNNLNWVLIRDNANQSQTMTVTNDAENVVKFLKEKAILIGDAILYSICTDNSIDILEHDGNGKFLGFRYAFAHEDEFFNAMGGQNE
jgi:hypothetical protein